MHAIEINELIVGHYDSLKKRWCRGEGNSANGFGVQFEFYNSGIKPIKYVSFTVVPINTVGDIVASSISGESEITCKLTGPFACDVYHADENDRFESAMFDCLWYNPNIARVRLLNIDLVFMDGTEETIDEENVVMTRDENSVWWERYGKKEREELLANSNQRASDVIKSCKLIYFPIICLPQLIKPFMWSRFSPDKDVFDVDVKAHAKRGKIALLMRIISYFLAHEAHAYVTTNHSSDIMQLVFWILAGVLFLGAGYISVTGFKKLQAELSKRNKKTNRNHKKAAK